MKQEKRIVGELFDTVSTLRDELRVQAHLAKKDASDEWRELEERWKVVEKERQRIRGVVEETAGETLTGVKLVLEELRDGYRNLRDR